MSWEDDARQAVARVAEAEEAVAVARRERDQLLADLMDGPAATRPSAYRIAQVTGLSGTYVRRIGSGR